MEDGHLIAVGTPQRVSSSSDRFFFSFQEIYFSLFPLSLSLSLFSFFPTLFSYLLRSFNLRFIRFFFYRVFSE